MRSTPATTPGQEGPRGDPVARSQPIADARTRLLRERRACAVHGATFFTDTGIASVAVTARDARSEREAALRRLRTGKSRWYSPSTSSTRASTSRGRHRPVPASDGERDRVSATARARPSTCRRQGVLTVLDFIGTANRRFRFVDRFGRCWRDARGGEAGDRGRLPAPSRGHRDQARQGEPARRARQRAREPRRSDA